MSHETLVSLAAMAALLGLMAYALLGGADFGGGVWDLFATGPRQRDQRDAISRAMGPVWEANHVWMIFVIVVLFTCFPYGYSSLGVTLFVPFHLALLGIMLRGASFIFRGYARSTDRYGRVTQHAAIWGGVFGVASVVSPFLLGAAFGAITEGGIRIGPAREVRLPEAIPWLSPYAIGCGLLALSTCAYLAAVYLTVETSGDLQDDFRRRAILSGTTTAGLALIVLLLAYIEANWFFRQLISPRSLPVVMTGLACFAASAWSLVKHRYWLSRIFAAGEIILLLLGWGLAHRPYLIYPDLTLMDAAGPAPTIAFLLTTIPFAALLLIPSLWLLFSVFKAPIIPKE